MRTLSDKEKNELVRLDRKIKSNKATYRELVKAIQLAARKQP